MSEKPIDYSALDGDTNEAYTQINGVAIPKYNRNTQRYKLWNTTRHVMLFDKVDIYTDIAKENKNIYANIMLLISHTDITNMLMIRQGNRYYPVTTEEGIMSILRIKKTAWYKLKPFLFNKILPVLIKSTLSAGDKEYYTYYINPLLSVDYRGISIPCYRIFREYLKDYLCSADYYTLEKWSSEYTGNDESFFLSPEQVSEVTEKIE